MKFGEFKTTLNRHPGKHMWASIHIGLGLDGVIELESSLLDYLDDYEVPWVAPSMFGEDTVTTGISTVTHEQIPTIEIHLKEKGAPAKKEAAKNGK